MGAMFRMQAIKQYQHSSVDAVAGTATPHQLVAMLLEGALDRLARARGALRNGDRIGKLSSVASTISIIEYLKLSLDLDAGGAIAQRLSDLYEFCLGHLAKANAADDPHMLDQVANVLRPLKQGWDEMPRGAPES